MFGYVTPCKMELKVKDYEKFKAYYCGLCKSIRNHIGNVPRLVLNYDMTFLAVLLDSLEGDEPKFNKEACIRHPIKKRIVLQDNGCLEYAAFCNAILAYYKLLDNVMDENSLKGKAYSSFLKLYLDKLPENFRIHKDLIKSKLNDEYLMEKNPNGRSLDELSHPFAELTGYILSSYKPDKDEGVYRLGYNLGKWIYIIDAFDDLKDDMVKNKFNAINKSCNINNMQYDEFSKAVQNRIRFVLESCGRQCLESLGDLNIKKNKELLENILQFGLLEKMDKVFNKIG